MGKKEAAEYEVEKIVSKRSTPKGVQYLVKWVGYASNQNTWEPIENFPSKSSQKLIAKYERKSAEQKNNAVITSSEKKEEKIKTKMAVQEIAQQKTKPVQVTNTDQPQFGMSSGSFRNKDLVKRVLKEISTPGQEKRFIVQWHRRQNKMVLNNSEVFESELKANALKKYNRFFDKQGK